jgi:uncharacterized protein YbjT (DUF2867 family)
MIAIMGASGNLGSKVADLLLQDGQDVRVFGRSTERLEPLGGRGAEIVVGDAIRAETITPTRVEEFLSTALGPMSSP